MDESQKRQEFTYRWLDAEPSISAYVFASIAGFHDAEDVVQRIAQELARRFDEYDSEQPFSLNYPMHGFKHEPFDGGIRVPYIVWSASLKASADKPARYDGLVSVCDILPTALKYVAPSTDLTSLKIDGIDLMPYLTGQKQPLQGRQYLNVRTLNHLSNTWDGGRGTKLQ